MPLGAPAPSLSFCLSRVLLLFDYFRLFWILALSCNREIRNSSDGRVWIIFVFLEVGSNPEAKDTENNVPGETGNRGFELDVETVWHRTEPEPSWQKQKMTPAQDPKQDGGMRGRMG